MPRPNPTRLRVGDHKHRVLDLLHGVLAEAHALTYRLAHDRAVRHYTPDGRAKVLDYVPALYRTYLAGHLLAKVYSRLRSTAGSPRFEKFHPSFGHVSDEYELQQTFVAKIRGVTALTKRAAREAVAEAPWERALGARERAVAALELATKAHEVEIRRMLLGPIPVYGFAQPKHRLADLAETLDAPVLGVALHAAFDRGLESWRDLIREATLRDRQERREHAKIEAHARAQGYL